MMTFVLIVMLNSGNGPAISMQEFNSKATCEAASETVKDKVGFLTNSHITCVSK